MAENKQEVESLTLTLQRIREAQLIYSGYTQSYQSVTRVPYTRTKDRWRKNASKKFFLPNFNCLSVPSAPMKLASAGGLLPKGHN
jgi:hypothetical protein